MVEGSIGKQLMAEVETRESRKVQIRAVLGCHLLAESVEDKRVVAMKTQYPEVPDRVIKKMVPATKWEAGQIPLNRRKRRQVEKAARVVVHVFSGKDRERWKR